MRPKAVLASNANPEEFADARLNAAKTIAASVTAVMRATFVAKVAAILLT